MFSPGLDDCTVGILDWAWILSLAWPLDWAPGLLGLDIGLGLDTRMIHSSAGYSHIDLELNYPTEQELLPTRFDG